MPKRMQPKPLVILLLPVLSGSGLLCLALAFLRAPLPEDRAAGEK